ncbi:MAG: SBBP repeat-containing protein [Candidatus Aminicenantes bacterium]|nr:SBBP repeat-containing protein [Candidatus Aminicenantes bacterium]
MKLASFTALALTVLLGHLGGGVDVPGVNVPPTSPRIIPDLGRTPLLFIANTEAAPDGVLYLARTPRYTLGVARNSLVFDGTRMVFRDANPRAKVVPLDPAESRVNLFLGADPAGWRTDIPCFRAVLIKQVYPGIDLKVYGVADRVEYDWILEPGADPEKIRFEYESIRDAGVDVEGNLVVRTKAGEMIQGRLRAFQESEGEKTAVPASFHKLGGAAFGFKLGPYDRGRTLVIDPAVLAFSTYLGGDLNDYASAVAVDAAGYIYVTGKTRSPNFPVKTPFQTDRAIEDAFVAKFAPSGRSLVYSTYIGGSDYDFGLAIAVGADGCPTISGGTLSTDLPLKNPRQNDQPGCDAFVTKLTAAGNGLVFSTYLGGSELDESYDLALDPAGNAVVVGRTDSPDFPTLTPIQRDRPRADGFVAKLAGATGALIFATYIGGSGTDYINGVALDGRGAVYLTGNTDSTDLRLKNPYQTDRPGTDAFAMKLAANGRSLVFATYLGGNAYDFATTIAVDSSGSAWVTGGTDSTNFPLKYPFQKDQPGRDVFLAKFDPSGTALLYSTYLGGSDYDLAWAVAAGSDGSAYLVGETMSPDFPHKGSFQGDKPDSDAFVAKFKPDGSGLVYSSYLGGNGVDYAYGAALDAAGNLYVVGWTASTDFPTVKPFQADRGDRDGFLAKIIFSRSALQL